MLRQTDTVYKTDTDDLGTVYALLMVCGYESTQMSEPLARTPSPAEDAASGTRHCKQLQQV